MVGVKIIMDLMIVWAFITKVTFQAVHQLILSMLSFRVYESLCEVQRRASESTVERQATCLFT